MKQLFLAAMPHNAQCITDSKVHFQLNILGGDDILHEAEFMLDIRELTKPRGITVPENMVAAFVQDIHNGVVSGTMGYGTMPQPGGYRYARNQQGNPYIDMLPIAGSIKDILYYLTEASAHLEARPNHYTVHSTTFRGPSITDEGELCNLQVNVKVEGKLLLISVEVSDPDISLVFSKEMTVIENDGRRVVHTLTLSVK